MTVEQLLQVFAVTRDIVGDMRILDDVVAHERGQGRHADELVGLVEREEDGIDAFSLEKLFRIGKCLMRCVPCDGEHVFFVPEQTAGTVSVSAVGTGTAIAFIEFAMSCRVAGKFVESALFAHLLARENCKAGSFAVQKTKKNTLLRNTLEQIGFRTESDTADAISYSFTANLQNSTIVDVE